MSQWVKAWEWCLKTKDVPFVLKRLAEKRAAPIINRKARVKSRPAIKFPKGKDPRKAKKDLHAECEALCKALVFWRDCGDWDRRDGVCFTCGHYRTLQWGHFLPREKAVALRYSERATAGQCAQCNGPGHGEQIKFSDAIDKRDGMGTAGALVAAYYKKRFVWNKTTLKAERDRLAMLCREKGIPVDKVLRREAPGERSDPAPIPSPRNPQVPTPEGDLPR